MMKIRQAEWSFCFWENGRRYGVRIGFEFGPIEDFFVSEKQNRSLEKVRSAPFFFVVLDGDRFVWASDSLNWLCKAFDAELVEDDPHIKVLENPEPVVFDDLKN
jgi:hypothetical protein